MGGASLLIITQISDDIEVVNLSAARLEICHGNFLLLTFIKYSALTHLALHLGLLHLGDQRHVPLYHGLQPLVLVLKHKHNNDNNT